MELTSKQPDVLTDFTHDGSFRCSARVSRGAMLTACYFRSHAPHKHCSQCGEHHLFGLATCPTCGGLWWESKPLSSKVRL